MRRCAKVKANAGVAGVDGRTVGQTAEWIAQNRESFLAELHAGRYRPAAVQARDIAKAEGGTRRQGIPTVLDRVIPQAIHRKLSPRWEAEFSKHSFGYCPKRSAQDAVRAAQSHVRGGKSWGGTSI
jgi:RNA-directed DNA polymerase